MKRRSRVHNILFSLLIVFLPTQLGRHFWPPTAFIRGIRIDYLSPTIFATDVLLLILFAVWFLEEKEKLMANLKRLNKQMPWIILAVALILINIFQSSRTLVTIYSWARLAELALFFIYIRSLGDYPMQVLKKILPIPLLFSVITAIVQFMRGGSIGGLLYWLGERSFTLTTPGIAKSQILGRLVLRPYATFPHPNALAGFILITLILLFSTLVKKKQSKRSHLRPVCSPRFGEAGRQGRGGTRNLRTTAILIAFIGGVIALLLTLSLSSWIAAAVILVLAAYKKRKKAIVTATIVVIVLLGLFVVSPPEEASLVERRLQAAYAVNMIRSHPLTGVGLGNFIPSLNHLDSILPQVQSPFLYYQPVHNIFLLIAAETGAIGLLAFIWLLGKTLKDSEKKGKLSLTLAILAVMIIGMTDHYWLTLHQSRLLFTMILALAWREKTTTTPN